MYNNRKLKIAFAMGGGVSLGTFSGAALTECIKQLIVYGGYKDAGGNFNYYRDIEIDVLSGASAGAMSLSIMLRVFTGYNDILPLLGENENESPEAIINRLQQNLANEFKDRYSQLDEKQKANLLAAQVAQELQRYLWCNQVTIEELAGIGSQNQKVLSNMNSILDRGWLERMAKDSILPKENFTISTTSLLAPRVLFACTLTRLEGQELKAAEQFEVFEDETTNKLYLDLYNTVMKDAITSTTHKDLRVFDINLGKSTYNSPDPIEKRFPSRWLLAHAKEVDITIDGNSEKRKIFPLEAPDFWGHIVATAIAAGTFPIAFEPTMLTRYEHELDIDAAVKPATDTVYSYIDGGTFNNEPISEAFRLASFLDSDSTGLMGEDFDRFVFFVDPFISLGEDIKQVPYNRSYTLKNDKTEEVPGIVKLAKFAPSMISVLRSEGAVSEFTKSVAVFDRFQKRKKLKAFYSKTIDNGLLKDTAKLSDAEITAIVTQKNEIIRDLTAELKKQYDRQMIPAMSLSFDSEIRRVLLDPENQEYFEEVRSNFENSYQQNDDIKDDYKAFFEGESLNNIRYFNIWLKSLFFAYIELVLDLSDKNENAILIPIGPLKFEGENFTQISLEGQKISGFYGFFHKNIRDRDFQKGVISAKNVLSKLNFLGDKRYNESGLIPISNEQQEKEEIKEVYKKVLQARVIEQVVGNNVKQIVGGRWVPFVMNVLELLGKDDQWLDVMASNLTDEPKVKLIPVELWIKVPDNDYQIAKNGGGADIDPKLIDGHYYLIYIANAVKVDKKDEFIWDKKSNSGHVDPNNQLRIVKDKFILPDAKIGQITLPGSAQLTKAILDYPNPIFEIDLDGADDPKNPVWQMRNVIEPLEKMILKR